MFLAKKDFDGKLRQNDSASKTTTGDLATLTANSGKDMYLGKAYCNIRADDINSNSDPVAVVELSINGTVVETYSNSSETSTSANDHGSTSGSHEFIHIGHKVATTEIIKLEVISVTNCKIDGAIVCFEEATGATPVI